MANTGPPPPRRHSIQLPPGLPPPPPEPRVGLRIAVVVAVALVIAGFAAWRAWPHDRGERRAAPSPVVSPSPVTESTTAVLPEIRPTCTGLECRFQVVNYTQLGSLLLNWDFGDGAKKLGSVSVLHTYAKAGDYNGTAVLELPGGAAGPSTSFSVQLGAWEPTVRLEAGAAGSGALTATIGGPSQCRGTAYELRTFGSSGAWSSGKLVRRGVASGTTLRFTGVTVGTYRLGLAPATRPGGVCAAATSAPARLLPSPPPPPVRTTPVYVPPQPIYTPPPANPQPSHYTPPPLK